MIGRTQASLLIVALVLLALLTACGSPGQALPPQATRAPAQTGATAPPPTGEEPMGFLLNPAKPAPDFTLTDQDGHPFRLAEQQGHILAIFVGYTHCPDVCPMTLAWMRQAYEQLGDAQDDVRYLFITADPERDTPEKLKRYLANWQAPLTCLTGSLDEVATVWEQYGAAVAKVPLPNGDYSVNHSAEVWLVDREGQLRVFHLLGGSPEALANDLLWLVRDGGELK